MENNFVFITAGTGGDGVGRGVGVGGSGGSVYVNVNNVDVNNIYREESSVVALLQSLPHVPHAGYDSGRKDLPPPCLEGTRVNVLEDIMSWLERTDDGTPPVYWLSGLAGIGKSAIARTIAERAHEERMLGASFFFSRSDQSLSDPQTLFPTLAFQLANASDTFRNVIVDALKRDPEVAHRNLLLQLVTLIVAPLRTIDPKQRTTLIVLDAMDECKDRGAEEILRLLFSYATQIPFLRILVTSRPEPRISSVFADALNHAKTVLHDIEASVIEQDIRLYILTELANIPRRLRLPMSANWAKDAEINSLVERSGKLFIYAATCVRFINDARAVSPRRRLRLVLDTRTAQATGEAPYRELDALYTEILRNSLSEYDSEFDREAKIKCFQAIVGSIVVLREPIPLFSLAKFTQYDTEAVYATLYHLHSVIILPSKIDEAPRFYHPSFLDFITDPLRCSDLPDFVIVPVPHQERRYAIRCVQLMGPYLKRDIAAISDPSVLNNKVDALELKVNAALPLEVQYACKFWASHLSLVGFGDQGMVDALEGFSRRSILWWLEAMSLMGNSFSAAGCIQEAHRWAAGSRCETTVVTILSDMYRFILAHAQVIRESALQVYFSALPFIPHDTALYNAYCHEANDSIRVLQGVESHWPQTMALLLGHSDAITSIAFSPDRLRLASGSKDCSVQLWDATSGEPIAALRGHTGGVTSVAFSPLQLASGSHDHSVRLWDATSGEPVIWLKGHSDSVRCVAFSPDALRLASGSHDHSVRLWDATSGTSIATLKGHSDWVRSVAFSPEGLWLASASDDRSVWLWDAASGRPIKTLKGHSDWVTSVAFSPDGLWLASGSADRSVWLWNARSYKPIAVLEGHSDIVTSVAFSPDGLRLASGSEDRSIQLWETTSRTSMTSLEGHSGDVSSVAFSPDGLQLASGSHDRSVRLWDATLRNPITSLERHSDSVRSVALSSDGLRLASASDDRSIRLWDATSGKPIASLEGHFAIVASVAFSPDGSRLASGSRDLSVQLWDASSGGPRAPPTGLARLIERIAPSLDTTLRKPTASLQGHSSTVTSVAFSRDGSRLASGSDDCSIRLWDVTSGKPIASLKGLSGGVNSVAFSPDGLRLASSSNNQSVQLWDAASRKPIASLEGHSGFVKSVAFSVDGHMLISRSENETFIWDLTSRPPFRLVPESHATPLPPTAAPRLLIWSYHEQWLQVRYLPGNHVRPICRIPALYLPSTEVQVTSLPTESRVAIGCLDGRVIILHIPASMYIV